MQSEQMTLKELAEYLQLAEKRVSKLAQTGEIPCCKVSGLWRFDRLAIDEWKIGRPSASDRSGLLKSLSLADVLSPDRIKMKLLVSKKEPILRELVSLVIPPNQKEQAEKPNDVIDLIRDTEQSLG